MPDSFEIRLRPATLADTERLLAWRNDPETQQQSKIPGEVFMPEHTAWLHKTLDDPRIRLRIALLGDTPVGSVRANADGAGWILSWTVSPAARGRNVGYRMVARMIDELSGTVRADIKPENPASMKIAEKLGMRQVEDEDGMTVWILNR